MDREFCKDIPEDILRRAVEENHDREMAAIPPIEELERLYASGETNEERKKGAVSTF